MNTSKGKPGYRSCKKSGMNDQSPHCGQNQGRYLTDRSQDHSNSRKMVRIKNRNPQPKNGNRQWKPSHVTNRAELAPPPIVQLGTYYRKLNSGNKRKWKSVGKTKSKRTSLVAISNALKDHALPPMPAGSLYLSDIERSEMPQASKLKVFTKRPSLSHVKHVTEPHYETLQQDIIVENIKVDPVCMSEKSANGPSVTLEKNLVMKRASLVDRFLIRCGLLRQARINVAEVENQENFSSSDKPGLRKALDKKGVLEINTDLAAYIITNRHATYTNRSEKLEHFTALYSKWCVSKKLQPDYRRAILDKHTIGRIVDEQVSDLLTSPMNYKKPKIRAVIQAFLSPSKRFTNRYE